MEIVKETYRSIRIRPADGKTEKKRARQNAPHVTPIVQLESPRFILSIFCVLAQLPQQSMLNSIIKRAIG
jgi:hypothetical protein